uniref:Phosphatidylinositol 4-kinase n=1 Tax=Ulva partita TaxID=1605170 RepID=A0A1C9ZPP1_9CHLO|nr:phosphatidylinositol 4-kinase [Ulva partita]
MTSEEYIKFVYGDNLDDVRRRIQRISPFGSQQGWNCHAVIVKSGDDCRQELLAMQLIEAFQRVFDVESLPLWLQPYKVLPTSSQTALIELLPDTLSVHSIKRSLPSGSSLADHFFRMFPKGTQTCEAAQRSFAQSLAGVQLWFVIFCKSRIATMQTLCLIRRCDLLRQVDLDFKIWRNTLHLAVKMVWHQHHDWCRAI